MAALFIHTEEDIFKMEEGIPLQAKLVNQKLLKTELQVEQFIQDIRKCEVAKSDITKMHFAARKDIMGIKNDLQV